MNYAQINQRYLCGIDLHASSMYLKILDREGQVLYKRNMPNNFALFKKILAPYLPDIAVGVESTFNYYWLYDGCEQAGIPSSEPINAYNQKLEAKRCAKLARGIISHKFAVAVYHILQKKTAFDEDRFLKMAS